MAKHHRFLLFHGERSANNYYPQAITATLTAVSEQTPTAHHLKRPANPVLSDLRTGLPPQSRLRDEKRSEHLMRKSRFSKTPSETAVAFLLFSLSVWFLLFLLLRKKKQEK